jgi:hypothetical protein
MDNLAIEWPPIPKAFYNELAELIRKYSLENRSDTPDFMLANFLIGCFESFNQSLRARESWYGRQILLRDSAQEHSQPASPSAARCAAPPIGIMPNWAWREKVRRDRAVDLFAAMARYQTAGKAIPKQWFDELGEIYDLLHSANAANPQPTNEGQEERQSKEGK